MKKKFSLVILALFTSAVFATGSSHDGKNHHGDHPRGGHETHQPPSPPSKPDSPTKSEPTITREPHGESKGNDVTRHCDRFPGVWPCMPEVNLPPVVDAVPVKVVPEVVVKEVVIYKEVPASCPVNEVKKQVKKKVKKISKPAAVCTK